MGRQYVHLSLDIKTAYQVGLRRTKNPTILQISALEAYKTGINFYQEKDGIWLSDSIPPQFITKI